MNCSQDEWLQEKRLAYICLKDIVRTQAGTNVRNRASQRVLEKAGFKKEGTIRKSTFVRGEWVDAYLYSIVREEWKEPKILIKRAS